MIRLLTSFSLLVLLMTISLPNFGQDTLYTTVYFEFNKSDLTDEARTRLSEFYAEISPLKVSEIRIEGHCDHVGGSSENFRLSEQRVKSVRIFMENSRLIAGQWKTNGFGKSRPLRQPEERGYPDQNRRVDLRVIGVKREGPPPPQHELPPPPKEDPLSEENLKVGAQIALKDINFVGGKAIMLTESWPALNRFVDAMKEHPTLEVEIGGHVCCYSDMPLSIARAKAVYDHLVEQGIDANRMTFKGYDRQKPLADESTELGRKTNRRVEITVLKL